MSQSNLDVVVSEGGGVTKNEKFYVKCHSVVSEVKVPAL